MIPKVTFGQCQACHWINPKKYHAVSEREMSTMQRIFRSGFSYANEEFDIEYSMKVIGFLFSLG